MMTSMFHRIRVGGFAAFLVASGAALGQQKPCDPVWKELAEARRDKLKDCMAKGGDCGTESKAYGEASDRAADCSPAPPPPQTAQPSVSQEPRAPANIPSDTSMPAAGANQGVRKYGSRGTVEFGGSLGFSSNIDTVTPRGGTGSTVYTVQASLNPTVGYFLVDGLELLVLGQLSFSTDWNASASLGSSVNGSGGIGLGYFFPVGDSGLRLGPVLAVEYGSYTNNNTSYSADTSTSGSGPEIGLEFVFKIPIGASSLLDIGIGAQIYFENVSATNGSTQTGTDFGGTAYLSVGFSTFL